MGHNQMRRLTTDSNSLCLDSQIVHLGGVLESHRTQVVVWTLTRGSLGEGDMRRPYKHLAHGVASLGYHMMMPTKVCHAHYCLAFLVVDETGTDPRVVLFGVLQIFAVQNWTAAGTAQ